MGPLALCYIALASTRAADRPFLIRRGRAAERRQAAPGHRRTSLPLAWLLAQGGDIVPISGTRRSERVEENVGADAIELGAGQLNRLNDVEPSVGDRYADMTPSTADLFDDGQCALS
jgi:aryl-alcohol dehydrogenase-like predicted oxidoreductase